MSEWWQWWAYPPAAPNKHIVCDMQVHYMFAHNQVRTHWILNRVSTTAESRFWYNAFTDSQCRKCDNDELIFLAAPDKHIGFSIVSQPHQNLVSGIRRSLIHNVGVVTMMSVSSPLPHMNIVYVAFRCIIYLHTIRYEHTGFSIIQIRMCV